MRKIDTSLIVRLCLPQFAVGLFTTMLNNYLIYFYQPSKESGIPNLIPQGRIVLGILTIIWLIIFNTNQNSLVWNSSSEKLYAVYQNRIHSIFFYFYKNSFPSSTCFNILSSNFFASETTP